MRLFVSVISGVSMVVSLYQVVRPCFRLILSPALFTEAKKLGIHCTLDTCGFAYRNTPEYHEVVDKLLAVY